jgi:hypothetical protein
LNSGRLNVVFLSFLASIPHHFEFTSTKETTNHINSVAHEDPPNIIEIVVTESQSHAVIVTGEDKCIRVFEISASGQLQQLSQRLVLSNM